jgi:hypothetical protein
MAISSVSVLIVSLIVLLAIKTPLHVNNGSNTVHSSGNQSIYVEHWIFQGKYNFSKKSLLSPTEDGHKKIGTLKVNHFQIRIYIIFYLDVGIFTPNLDLHLKDLCVLHVETM